MSTTSEISRAMRNSEPQAGRFVMQILTQEDGDKNLSWDKNDPHEIEDAQSSFDYWTKERGYKAYQVDAKGKQTLVEVKKFDPDLGALIVVDAKALVGG